MAYGFGGASPKRVTTDYTDFPDNLTFYMKMIPISFSGNPYIFCKEGGTSFDFSMSFVNSLSILYMEVIRATTDTTARFPLPAQFSFTNLIVTWDISDPTNLPRVWYDTAEQTATATQTGAGAKVNGPDPWRIAGVSFDGSGNNTFNGEIGRTAIWNRILEDDEIEALGKGFDPMHFRRDLVLYCPFDRGLDEYTGKTLTLTGSPTIEDNHQDLHRVKEF